jgi:uncharacterized membrane protein (DUF485 family)
MGGQAVDRMRTFLGKGAPQECASLFSGAVQKMAPLSVWRCGRKPMDETTLKRIERDPNYVKLVAERRSLGLTLSIAMIVIYFGFILLVAFAPGFLGASLTGGVTTIGIVVGILVILSAFALTGFYVKRANDSYDVLTQQIVRETHK